MAKIERFEDLQAWKKARLLTRSIYEITKHGSFGQDYGLSRQIQRASVSIMSNIAEGFERRTPGEFCQFLTVAKASWAELRSQLYVALDGGYLSQDTFDELSEQADELARIISGLRTSVERKRNEDRNKK
ncbi:MAG TPA: four helix bundle protein [Chloroflexia bacterium]|nr:four helix bundle protein [Chloroflexia bacterium]